jgi:hypothetical protein
MNGEGMLLVLNDVEPGQEDEFNLWYDTEHIQERLQIPGFLSARRYQALSGSLKYCTLYRTESIATFESDAYRQRLASQTEWSKRMLKAFVEPNRLVGNIRESVGTGNGGRLALLKLLYRSDDRSRSPWESAVVSEIAKSYGVVTVSLFEAVPQLSGPVKEYRPVLAPLLKADDRLVLVEVSNSPALEDDQLGKICARVGVRTSQLGVYSFSWGQTSPRTK